VSNQVRRKPGVYSRRKNNGELESEFNLAKGANFSLSLDPETQLFNFNLRSANRKFNLYIILNALGISDTDIEKV
jgi:DNA-directed RNA polymerase beta subunit